MWDKIKGWSTKIKLIVGGIALVLLIAISAGGQDGKNKPLRASEETQKQEQIQDGLSTDIDWGNHAPSVKRRIDSLAEKEDCQGLQQEFDTAEANNDAQLSRVGDGNSDLMGYIDEQMAAAGCYDD